MREVGAIPALQPSSGMQFRVASLRARGLALDGGLALLLRVTAGTGEGCYWQAGGTVRELTVCLWCSAWPGTLCAQCFCSLLAAARIRRTAAARTAAAETSAARDWR